jgi:Arabinose-binding domain of AraC transcription regulator, N-term
MNNGTSQALTFEQDLASIPTAQGGLSRLAIARLKSAGVPVAPLLRRGGLTPEVIADPEERLSVRSQIALLDEAAIALQDDCLGFTLARDFEPRELGLLYYVMASSPTLGDALKRVARYSHITSLRLQAFVQVSARSFPDCEQRLPRVPFHEEATTRSRSQLWCATGSYHLFHRLAPLRNISGEGH